MGFVRWYLWATAGLIAFTLAATAFAAYLRILATLRRHSRTQHRQRTVADIWQHGSRQIRGMLIVAVTVTLLGWAACGALAYTGSVGGLRDVRSLSQLAGTFYLAPVPEGPPVTGYTGAVIGDSRVSRLGGPPGGHAHPGRHRLRAQLRLAGGRTRRPARVERAEPGLPKRHHRVRPARSAGAGRTGAASPDRVCSSRYRGSSSWWWRSARTTCPGPTCCVTAMRWRTARTG